VLSADLNTVLGRAKVVETIRQQGPVTTLVNNAGFQSSGQFGDAQLDDQMEMVTVHINASMTLCRAVIPFMRKEGGGTIINVSTGGALTGGAGITVYAAYIAFLNSFSESLAIEEKPHNIKVQALCPGYTRTDFHTTAAFKIDGKSDVANVPDELWLTTEEVVAESLAALGGDQVIVVTGDIYKGFLKK
jgi:short-subunit dehydrogenase